MVLFTAEPRLSVLLDNTFVIGASCAVVILILTIVFVLIILKRKTVLNRQDNQQGHHLFSFSYCFINFFMMHSVNDPYSNNKMHYHVVISNDSYNSVLNWCMDVLCYVYTRLQNLYKTDALVTYLIYILTNKGIQALYKNKHWIFNILNKRFFW